MLFSKQNDVSTFKLNFNLLFLIKFYNLINYFVIHSHVIDQFNFVVEMSMTFNAIYACKMHNVNVHWCVVMKRVWLIQFVKLNCFKIHIHEINKLFIHKFILYEKWNHTITISIRFIVIIITFVEFNIFMIITFFIVLFNRVVIK